MCAPMAIGIIGAVASMAAGLISMQAQQSAMKKQEEANAQWAAYQKRERNEAWQREEQYRQNAEAARQNTITEMEAQKQKEAQGTEEERLKKDITPESVKPSEDTGMVAIGDELLRGQGGADPLVTGDLQKKINNAAVESRKRIANLATIQSYGGSQFGLQNRAQDLFNKSGQDIRFQGNLRQGNLGALGIAGQVEPARIQSTPSMAGGIASSLASIAGKGLSGGFGA